MVANERPQFVEDLLGIFDALEGEQREHFAADLERLVYPDELAIELRTTAQLVEGFCIAAEGVNFTTLLVMSDCRERVRRAREIAEQTTRP
jgi:hypothetical protein